MAAHAGANEYASIPASWAPPPQALLASAPSLIGSLSNEFDPPPASGGASPAAIAATATAEAATTAAAAATADGAAPAVAPAAMLLTNGRTAFQAGNLDDARHWFGAAAEAALSAGEHLCRARALANLGTVHKEAGRSVDAVTPLLQAVELLQRLDQRAMVPHVLNTLTLCHMDVGRPDLAVLSCQQHLSALQLLGDSVPASDVSSCQSRLMQLQGQL